MERYIDTKVQRIIRRPTEGSLVNLLVGVSEEGSLEDTREEIEDLGPEEITELAFGTLVVEIRETAVESLSKIDSLESVEVEGEIETLTAGN